MDDCWISCQIMADMKKVYDDLIIINLYLSTEQDLTNAQSRLFFNISMKWADELKQEKLTNNCQIIYWKTSEILQEFVAFSEYMNFNWGYAIKNTSIQLSMDEFIIETLHLL